MNWLGIVIAFLLFSTGALAQTTSGPPPDWMVRGFEAALADSRGDVRVAALINAGDLAGGIPPGPRARAAIDNGPPLLAYSGPPVRRAASQVLAIIPPGERAGILVDNLLPLLADSARPVRGSAALALGVVPLGEHAGTVIDKLLPFLMDGDL